MDCEFYEKGTINEQYNFNYCAHQTHDRLCSYENSIYHTCPLVLTYGGRWSASTLAEFNKCQYSYMMSELYGWKEVTRPLSIKVGSLVHSALEVITINKPEKLAALIERIDANIETREGVEAQEFAKAKGVIYTLKNNIREIFDNLEIAKVLTTEQRFYRLYNKLFLVGVVDALAVRNDNQIVLEYKYASSADHYTTFANAWQNALYSKIYDSDMVTIVIQKPLLRIKKNEKLTEFTERVANEAIKPVAFESSVNSSTNKKIRESIYNVQQTLVNALNNGFYRSYNCVSVGYKCKYYNHCSTLSNIRNDEAFEQKSRAKLI